ncbi:MAG TPA: hypothetical protein VJ904_11140, partial [Tichowtungia sp.]|nr:hypothetical protein [Tichowtungia sp.]
PTALPCDSPNVVTLKSVPNVLLIIVSLKKFQSLEKGEAFNPLCFQTLETAVPRAGSAFQ